MRKLAFLSVALVALCSTVNAETLSEKMTKFVPQNDTIIRGQSCCYPYYIAISGGLTIPHDLDPPGAAQDVDFGVGHALNIALGWYEDDYRIELEYSQFGFTVDRLGGAGVVTGNAGGDAWMINGYYDTDLGMGLTGYAGGGLGIARAAAHSLGVAAGGGVTATSEPTFAYQARVGVSRCLTQRADLFGGYRFLGTADFELDPIGGGTLTDNLLSHTFEAGLRFKF